MLGMNEFETLQCPCGSTDFMELSKLTWKEGGGTVRQPVGWLCRACNVKVDTAKLIQELQLRRKRKELQALEEEVGACPSGNTTKATAKK